MKIISVPTGNHVFVSSSSKIVGTRANARKKQLNALELQAKLRGTGDTKTRRKSDPPQKRGGAADCKGRKKALPRGDKSGGSRSGKSKENSRIAG